MTRDFDPARHKIVAVVDHAGHPDHGQQFHVSMPDLVAEIEQATTKIKLERDHPCQRDAMPLAPLMMPEITDRIAALEQHAAAQQELGTALSSILMLVNEMGNKTQVLEREARETRRVVEIVAPALAAIGRR